MRVVELREYWKTATDDAARDFGISKQGGRFGLWMLNNTLQQKHYTYVQYTIVKILYKGSLDFETSTLATRRIMLEIQLLKWRGKLSDRV